MPEHRPGTPGAFVTLESFLWWDFRDAEDWTQWARRLDLTHDDDLMRAAFGRARTLQEALRKLERGNNGAVPDPSAVDLLNTLIDRLKLRPRVSASGEIALASANRPNDDPIAVLLVMALDAMTAGIWRRFKLCRDPACSASFYDASKSATKVWCSMELCGSRNKMRRLRDRQKS